MLKVNQTYVIKKYKKNLNRCYKQKLIAMGFIPGVSFVIKRIAPLGNPIQLEIHGYSLSLRNQELDLIEVENI